MKDIANPMIELASSPKVAALVAASTGAVGTASRYELIQGTLNLVTLTVACITGIVVLAIQTIKLVRVWRAWHADKPEPQEF